MKDIWVVDVELGKKRCSLVGLDAAGHVVLRRRIRRDGVVGLAQTAHSVSSRELTGTARRLHRNLYRIGPVFG
jgi:transposase